MWGVLRRDLTLAWRRRGDVLTPLIFLLIVCTLFPLGLGDDPELLAIIAPAVVWVGALLASLLSLEQMFKSDFDDGSVEQLLLSDHALPKLTLAKALAHWLVTGLPMVLIGPILAVGLQIPTAALPTLLFALLLGTPTLSLLGGIGVALSAGLRRGGMFLSLLVLPFYVPVLIFAAAATSAAAHGLPATTQLKLLAALLVLAITLSPFAIAAALRIGAASQ